MLLLYFDKSISSSKYFQSSEFPLDLSTENEMKWFKVFFLLSLFGAVISTMHGRGYYERLRSSSSKIRALADKIQAMSEHYSDYNEDPETDYMNYGYLKRDEKPKSSKKLKCKEKANKKTDKKNGFEVFAANAANMVKNEKSKKNGNGKHKCKGKGFNGGGGGGVKKLNGENNGKAPPVDNCEDKSKEAAAAAMEAAKSAEAEMLAKSNLVANLGTQLNELKQKIQTEEESLKKVQETITSITAAQEEADTLYCTLNEALEKTTALVKNMDQLREGLVADLNDKMETLSDSKLQVESALQQLKSAVDDFEKTQVAACHAAEASKSAQEKVSSFRRRSPNHRKRRRLRFRRRRRRPGGQRIEQFHKQRATLHDIKVANKH